MMSEYERIFAERGRSYDLAMRKRPTARDTEFRNLFRVFTPQPGSTVLDIPSGGGYLARHLPEDCILESVEPSDQFLDAEHLSGQADLEDLQLRAKHYEVVVCLAASHHIKNKQGLFDSVHTALKSDGHFLLGDVLQGSPIMRFLDDFSSRYNRTGHSGDYLTIEAASAMAKNSGFSLLDAAEYPCPWRFVSREDLTEFCRLLFGLRKLEDALLFDTLADMVGVTETAAGVQLEWRLLYLTCRRDA